MLGVSRDGPLGPLRLAGPGLHDGPLPRAAEPFRGAAPVGAGRGTPRPGGVGSERDAWIVLASVEGIGPAAFGSLVRRFGSARAVLERAAAGIDALRDLPPDPDAEGRLRSDDEALARLVVAARAPEPLLRDVRDLGLTVLTLDDDRYPVRLRATELPPPLLFVLGDVAALDPPRAVAVVGTRRPTELGRRVAARIAGAVSRAGASVVSGLAIGIDGIAHEATVVEGGPTVAVLGAGHRHVTPAAHRALARRIVDGGGSIVSEFPPGARPTRWSFPRRNRVISGLSEATVVVEAAIRSGALITAAWALEQGRECFLVPGSLDDAAAQGCLRFLRDHAGLARIVAGIPELLEDLGLGTPDVPATLLPPGQVAGRVAGLVAEGVGTVDELAVAADLPAAAVLGALTILELHGLVRPVIGRYRPAGTLATRSPERRRGGSAR